MLQDIIVGKSVANAIKYFGSRNMLGSSNSYFAAFKNKVQANDVVVGRQKDRTLEQELREHGEDARDDNGVNLIYRDKQGN